MSAYPTIDDTKLDYLVKAISDSSLHCKVTIFIFVINAYFLGKYFETNMLFFNKTPPIRFSIH